MGNFPICGTEKFYARGFVFSRAESYLYEHVRAPTPVLAARPGDKVRKARQGAF
jgi:hypothetical protein